MADSIIWLSSSTKEYFFILSRDLTKTTDSFLLDIILLFNININIIPADITSSGDDIDAIFS